MSVSNRIYGVFLPNFLVNKIFCPEITWNKSLTMFITSEILLFMLLTQKTTLFTSDILLFVFCLIDNAKSLLSFGKILQII